MIKISIIEDEEKWEKCLLSQISIYFKSRNLDYFITKDSPDIAFIDIKLGEENGFDIAKKIKEKNKHTVIIFVTAYQEYTREAFEIEAFGYLVKPVTQKEINSKLNKAIIYINGLTVMKSNEMINLGSESIRKKMIISIETTRNGIIVNTLDSSQGIVIQRVFLKELAKTLSPEFIYIRKNVIINSRHIIKYNASKIVLTKNIFYYIPRLRKEEVMNRLVSLERSSV